MNRGVILNNNEDRVLFQSGDSSLFKQNYLGLLNEGKHEEAFNYIQSFMPLLGKGSWPEDEDNPFGLFADWMHSMIFLKYCVGEEMDIPDFIDWFFTGESQFPATPRWAATIVANFVSELISIEEIPLEVATFLLSWSIERGAKNREIQLSALKVSTSEANVIDQLRVENEAVNDFVVRTEIAYITTQFAEEQTRNRTFNAEQLTNLLNYLSYDERAIDPINIGNLQWYSLATFDSTSLKQAYNSFREREEFLRNNFDVTDLANCIGNHAHIGSIIDEPNLFPTQQYFEEAISLGNLEASAIYCTWDKSQDLNLKNQIKNWFSQNPDISRDLLIQIESGLTLLNSMSNLCQTNFKPINSLAMLRFAKDMLEVYR